MSQDKREKRGTAHREAVETLLTVRDWLRHAVSRFNTAGLSYGHGTANALDEAAFLILETLRLPIDRLDPWLDAHLLVEERIRLADIIDARVVTRKPASYLTKSAYIRDRRFYVDERVIVPRSYIGELLDGGLEDVIDDPAGITTVLDLCTGGGSLAILAAETFANARVDAVDLSQDALEVAAKNVADYALGNRITLLHSDLFAALKGRRYDLILSNPPYVTDASLAAFPPEHRAEPQLAHAGGTDGLDVVRRILVEAPNHLTPEGSLVVEVGRAREAIEASYALPFLWLDTEESVGEVFALRSSDFADFADKGARRRKRR